MNADTCAPTQTSQTRPDREKERILGCIMLASGTSKAGLARRPTSMRLGIYALIGTWLKPLQLKRLLDGTASPSARVVKAGVVAEGVYFVDAVGRARARRRINERRPPCRHCVRG